VEVTSVSVGSATRLFRFGLEYESAAELAERAAIAQQNGFPHGISAFTQSSRADAVGASIDDVQRYFAVHKTGRNPYHVTIELPKPVTDEIAHRFNQLFGRPTPP
jgi:hypothetical protein